MMKLMTTILLFLMTSGGMRRATVWLSVAMLVVTGLNASATEPAKGKDEWPVFRGDQGFVGVVDQELPATLKQLWKFKAKGGFTGSPIAAGGRVFAADSSGFVYAVQFDTGMEIWKKELPDAWSPMRRYAATGEERRSTWLLGRAPPRGPPAPPSPGKDRRP